MELLDMVFGHGVNNHPSFKLFFQRNDDVVGFSQKKIGDIGMNPQADPVSGDVRTQTQYFPVDIVADGLLGQENPFSLAIASPFRYRSPPIPRPRYPPLTYNR